MVRDRLSNERTGHDWYHIERVTKLAQQIAMEENADIFIVTLAALLHDLADDKVVANEKEGMDNIQAWLKDFNIREVDCDHIIQIVSTMSFKGGNNQLVNSLEAKVVQDADRLDAIGAIGIARCFIYAGKKGTAMYDPTIEIREEMTVEEYRKGKSSGLHHFYEKLLKLKNLMNTKTGYQLAIERHAYIEQYLKQFLKEFKLNDTKNIVDFIRE